MLLVAAVLVYISVQAGKAVHPSGPPPKHHQAHRARPTSPPKNPYATLSESQIQGLETTEVQGDLPTLNHQLGQPVFVGFRVFTAPDGGLPQFDYIVNEDLWNAIPESQRAHLAQYGWLFNETDRVWKKYHGGHVCFPERLDFLTLRVTNTYHVVTSLKYTVLVDQSECGS